MKLLYFSKPNPQIERITEGVTYALTITLISGTVKNWWDDKTDNEFLKKAECMKDQYNNYTIKQISRNVNGSFTLGENIADSGGVKEAYHAYRMFYNIRDMLLSLSRIVLYF